MTNDKALSSALGLRTVRKRKYLAMGKPDLSGHHAYEIYNVQQIGERKDWQTGIRIRYDTICS